MRRYSFALALLLLSACDSGSGGSGGGPPMTPGEPTLSLAADPGAISVGEASELVATARDGNGNPMSGQAIGFATTRGRLSVESAQTDSTGTATSRLRYDGATGVATVTARLGTTTVSAEVEVEIGVGQEVRVTAAPEEIPADGEALITVRVTPRDGSAPPAGLRVDLATNLGRLTETDPRTDDLGVATSRLRANGDTGSALVSARLSETGEEGAIRVEIGAEAGLELRLRSRPSEVDTLGTSTLELQLTDDRGRPVSGEAIELETTLGRLEASRVTTGADGGARTDLVGEGEAGTARVTAEVVSSGTAASVEVSFLEARLEVRASRTQAAPGDQIELVVVASEPDGRPVAGASVRLSTSLGRLTVDLLRTDSSGLAESVLIGPAGAGTAIVRAELADRDASATLAIEFR